MTKKTSSTDKPSALRQIMNKGHQKVPYAERKRRLLMQLSENDHKRIAMLIARWLDEPDNDRKK